jgi:curved DNA-binding protein CbpA
MVRVNPDPYLALGVPPTATQAEIIHAYRTHLRAHHPDTRPARSAHTADEHLRRVLAAYALLRDPARRADYDRLIAHSADTQPHTPVQAIATVGSVMGGGEGPPPARIVLESDGAENVPLDPNAPQGAFTAARAAKDQGVQISTISFGTPYGTVEFEGANIPVPVDDQTLQKICEITDGQAFHADSLESLKDVYTTLQHQIGYETVKGDASLAWILLGTFVMAGAVLAGLVLNRRLPG